MMQSSERSTRSSKRYVTEPAPDHELQSTHMDTGQYICIECSETFNDKLELNSHRQSHVTKRQFTCSHCGRGFHHQVFLQMHERSHEVGISRSSLTKTSAGRTITTRSRKSLADTDIIHVTPAPSKSTYHLNSKVEFKREWNAREGITPRECVTRRTQGSTSLAHEKTDISDHTQFELRISKLSDSTIHLIDPYGNTIEILAEVFNAYTIREPDEESLNHTDDSEISATPTSSIVHLNMADEIANVAVFPQDLGVPSPQVEVSEVGPTKADALEENLPFCRIQSVSSASISPKTVPELRDDAEDILSTQTPCESDVQDVTSDEHVVNRLSTEMPKNSTEEILPDIVQGSLITADDQTVTEGSVVGDANTCNDELAVVTTQSADPSLNLGALDDPSFVQFEYSEVLRAGCLHTKDSPNLTKSVSPEPLVNLNNQEKDDRAFSHTAVTGNEMDPSPNVSTSINEVDLSLDMNEDNGRLVTLFVKNSQDIKCDHVTSLSSDIIENNMLPPKSGPEGTDVDEGEPFCRAEVPLPGPDKILAVLEDDETDLQTSLTLNECVSESDEHHKESPIVFPTRDPPGSLGLDCDLQTEQSTDNKVCNTPTDNANVNPEVESDAYQTASKSELEPGLSETDICRLNQGVHDESSHPNDICSSKPNSQNITNLMMSEDIPDQRRVGSSDEEGSLNRDIGERVVISLEKQDIEHIVIPDKLPDIANGTVPILQEVLNLPEECQELLGVDGHTEYLNTDVILDPSQKNASRWGPNSDNDLGMSSPVHDVQPEQSSNLEQDVNQRDDKKLEADSTANMKHIGFSENEEKHGGQIEAEVPVVTPVEVFSLTNIENTIEEAPVHENVQTSVLADIENIIEETPLHENVQTSVLADIENIIEETPLHENVQTSVLADIENIIEETPLHENIQSSLLADMENTTEEASAHENVQTAVLTNIENTIEEAPTRENIQISVLTDIENTIEAPAHENIQTSVLTDLENTIEETPAHENIQTSVLTDIENTIEETPAHENIQTSVLTDIENTIEETPVHENIQTSVLTDIDNTIEETPAHENIQTSVLTDIENTIEETPAHENIQTSVLTDLENTIEETPAHENIQMSVLTDLENTIEETPAHENIQTSVLTDIENTIEETPSHENIQTSVHASKCDVERISSFQKISVESGEDNPISVLETETASAGDGLLLPSNEDLSLRNYTECQDVAFSVQTLVSITSACVEAQERVLSQETKPPEQDAAASMEDDEFRSSRSIESSELIDDSLLNKLEGEHSGTTLCLLERTLDLPSDLEVLSEKCLVRSDVKDLTENDIDKNVTPETPHKQYIQMSNADLTENDLTDDFTGSGTILLDASRSDEATKEDDIAAVSVDDEGAVHDLSDILSPEIQETECTEGKDEKPLGFGGQCLNCGRRIRRVRKEMVWLPLCYKCRTKAKREQRHSGENTGHSPGLDRKKGSSDFSNIHIKQEDDVLHKTVKSVQSIRSIKKESAALVRKKYKCLKCEKSFKIPGLLAGHMKCHALPMCLSCGCPIKLKNKTKRIPKRCHKCFQKMKQQKKAKRVLCDGDKDKSLDFDSGSLSLDEADLQSLMDNELQNDLILSSTKLVEDPKPGSVKKAAEPFHSIFMRKRKKINPAIQALYCTCDVVLKSGARQPKICKNCQKPVRKRLVHGPTAGGKVTQLKKTKKQPPSDPVQHKLLLGESSVSHENELSPDELCKEEIESSTKLDIKMVTSDGQKTPLCTQCGRIFKCNRSLNLHLMSHMATQCESCGCRLHKKKRAVRSKKCAVCRLLSKDKGLPDSAIEEVLPSDKITKENTALLRQKMKNSKIVRRRKIQTIAKHKDHKWMNMILAVKGLTRKPRKKKEQSVNGPSEEKLGYSSEPAVYSGTEDQANNDPLRKCDPGSSGLQVSKKKMLGGKPKVNKKCMYREKNIIKVEEQQLPSYIDDPSSTPLSVKEEEDNRCLECNKIFPSFDLLLSHQQDHIEDQPFTCPQCPQKFSAEQYLSIHISSHAEGPPFRCLECNKTFTRRNNLGVHKRVHTGLRPFACPDCPCSFRQKGSLIVHRYTHRNLQLILLKPYQCSVCNKSFKQKERLVIHERVHTGECPFSCKDCDKVFPSRSRLYVHRKIHKVSVASEQNASCKEESEGPPYQCKDCDKICSTKASFVLHRKVHKSSTILDHSGSHERNQEETTSEIRLASEQDLGIKTELDGNPFACKDCNKVCSTKASFVLHRKMHRRSDVGSPTFVCKDCGKICSTKASLVLHRRVHNSAMMCDLKANLGDPPYICQDCNKVCSTKASFVLHRRVHKTSSDSEQIPKTNVEHKSFVCKKCKFVCSTKASFVLHRKVHRSSPSAVQNLKDGTVEHPFTCKDCGKICSTKASFVLHCKVHKALPSSGQSLIPQADVEDKPYHCKVCSKIYSTKGRLLSHIKLHTGEDVSADGEQELKMDTEDKPFACPVCHMKFTRLKILVRHRLIHGEDVFRCIHCGKRFLFQKTLINHLQVCLKRGKGKGLMGNEKVPKKRKSKDESNSEQSTPKKSKIENKKAEMAVQKLKNKKLIKAKKLAINKEKSKAKIGHEKKPKKPKGEAEQDLGTEDEKQSDGKQEKVLETVSKEKEIGKDKKPKDVGKVKKVLKKVPPKQKRQKISSESLKKWRIIAAATVKKRKLQAVINGGKKKMTVKKNAQNKAKTGGKNSKE